MRKSDPAGLKKKRWLVSASLMLLLLLAWYFWPDAELPVPPEHDAPTTANQVLEPLPEPAPVEVGTITFLGAAGQVSGSCHLVRFEDVNFMIDAGIFYEDPKSGRSVDSTRALSLYTDLPIPPKELDFIFVTHAHLDHAGRLPYLFALGARPRIILSPATRDILQITLPDQIRSADMPDDALIIKKGSHIYHSVSSCPIIAKTPPSSREKLSIGRSAAYEKRFILCSWCLEHEFSRMESRMLVTDYEEERALTDRLKVELFAPGHMLGAAWLKISYALTPETALVIAASGDMGDGRDPFFPRQVREISADYALVESTYGGGGEKKLILDDSWDEFLPFLDDLKRAIVKKQVVLIPAFVTDRAHKVLAVINWGMATGRLPAGTPVYLTSSTAAELVDVYSRYLKTSKPYYSDRFKEISADLRGRDAFKPKALVEGTAKKYPRPSLVVAHSAMMEHGEAYRIAAELIDDPGLHVSFVGYQAPWTPGGKLKNPDRETLEIGGGEKRIKATRSIHHVFSGHASPSDLMEWVQSVAPKQALFIVHGEKETSRRLIPGYEAITGLEGRVIVPEFEQTIPLVTFAVDEAQQAGSKWTESEEPPEENGGKVPGPSESPSITVSGISGEDVTISGSIIALGTRDARGRVNWPDQIVFIRKGVGTSLTAQARAAKESQVSFPLSVTRMTVKRIDKKSLIAAADVEFNGAIRVKDVKLLKNSKGEYWVSGPSEKTDDGWRDKVRFSKETAESLRVRFLEELKK